MSNQLAVGLLITFIGIPVGGVLLHMAVRAVILRILGRRP